MSFAEPFSIRFQASHFVADLIQRRTVSTGRSRLGGIRRSVRRGRFAFAAAATTDAQPLGREPRPEDDPCRASRRVCAVRSHREPEADPGEGELFGSHSPTYVGASSPPDVLRKRRTTAHSLLSVQECGFVNFVSVADAMRAKEDVLNRLGGQLTKTSGLVRIGYGKGEPIPGLDTLLVN